MTGVLTRVISVQDRSFSCEVVVGGKLSNRKGISVLGGGICAPMLTDKDLDDLSSACAMGVDMIALSFPATSDDILRARELIDAHDPSIGIISKIERKEAIDNLDDIVDHSDVIMVARGDWHLRLVRKRSLSFKNILLNYVGFRKRLSLSQHR